jgi:hypothetical protein
VLHLSVFVMREVVYQSALYELCDMFLGCFWGDVEALSGGKVVTPRKFGREGF